ncbi:hypothetical protein C453_01585 [Haloferax elongans ATCC BAA-1513]|uniref:Uncharacterized protein n=1 Tax=Haloferax elongans ATCC BAA-1513 TaxID=1230453 RepID=M0HVA1_HALEO|nr:hypothetical protein C453_01585 [Haloferax elongans ATCC BAA-1513]
MLTKLLIGVFFYCSIEIQCHQKTKLTCLLALRTIIRSTAQGTQIGLSNISRVGLDLMIRDESWTLVVAQAKFQYQFQPT